jgi:ATP/maltotriose-dependent transcriptional regulator MalT
MARSLGDATKITAAAALSAFGAILSGDIERARAYLDEGMRIVDATSDEEIAHDLLARSVDPLAAAALYLERMDVATRLSERVLAIARATGQGQVLPVLFWAGVIRTATGKLAEAADLHDLAAEIARSSGHDEGIVWNLVGRSLTASAQGDYETALAAAEEADELLRRAEGSVLSMWARRTLATQLLATGSADRAATVLLDAGAGEEMPHIPPPWRAEAFEVLAGCRLAQGRTDDARKAVAAARATAERIDLRLPAAAAERAAASLALANGEPEAAARLALSAADAATEAGVPIEAAAARMLAGRALGAAGRREDALEQLEAAAAAFERYGALWRRDAVDRELGKLGRRRHRRTRAGKHDGSGVETLTERELEVAWLVVDRKTNAEIAAELFLSEKTVESHIRHLFQKLGVSSRVEVARAVERAEREGLAAR